MLHPGLTCIPQQSTGQHAAECKCHTDALHTVWGWTGCACLGVGRWAPAPPPATSLCPRDHSQDNLLLPNKTFMSPRELKGCKRRPATALRAAVHLLRVLEQGTFKANRHFFTEFFHCREYHKNLLFCCAIILVTKRDFYHFQQAPKPVPGLRKGAVFDQPQHALPREEKTSPQQPWKVTSPPEKLLPTILASLKICHHCPNAIPH